MGPSHGGGMPQQAVAPGPTYSPTPIQRPQGIGLFYLYVEFENNY